MAVCALDCGAFFFVVFFISEAIVSLRGACASSPSSAYRRCNVSFHCGPEMLQGFCESEFGNLMEAAYIWQTAECNAWQVQSDFLRSNCRQRGQVCAGQVFCTWSSATGGWGAAWAAAYVGPDWAAVLVRNGCAIWDDVAGGRAAWALVCGTFVFFVGGAAVPPAGALALTPLSACGQSSTASATARKTDVLHGLRTKHSVLNKADTSSQQRALNGLLPHSGLHDFSTGKTGQVGCTRGRD